MCLQTLTENDLVCAQRHCLYSFKYRTISELEAYLQSTNGQEKGNEHIDSEERHSGGIPDGAFEHKCVGGYAAAITRFTRDFCPIFDRENVKECC